MKEINFWKDTLGNLNKFGRLALAIVYDADHSTPGRVGFKMFVAPDGSMKGSVGGGKVEGMVIDECRELYTQPVSENYFKEYKLLGSAPDSIGMICNGVQIIGFVMLGEKEKPVIESILSSLETHSECFLEISNNFVKCLPFSVQKQGFDSKSGIYTEKIGARNRVYIFGGGHVGLAVSRLMSQLDFRVVVIDNRKDVSTLKENTFADEVVVGDFVESTGIVIEDSLSYIVIVTPGHLQDKDVLRAVLDKKVKYIGMMGSASKVKALYKELASEGIDPHKLDCVHSPIGFKIKSETPVEIAVSIAAEIISVKNAHKLKNLG